jgi:hypothetical protein
LYYLFCCMYNLVAKYVSAHHGRGVGSIVCMGENWTTLQ